MITPTQNSKPKPNRLPRSLLKALKSFGIEFYHDPNYKSIWIPTDKISIDIFGSPYIIGKQGDTEIYITKYPDHISIWIKDIYEEKRITLPLNIAIGYHEDSILIEIF